MAASRAAFSTLAGSAPRRSTGATSPPPKTRVTRASIVASAVFGNSSVRSVDSLSRVTSTTESTVTRTARTRRSLTAPSSLRRVWCAAHEADAHADDSPTAHARDLGGPVGAEGHFVADARDAAEVVKDDDADGLGHVLVLDVNPEVTELLHRGARVHIPCVVVVWDFHDARSLDVQ